jgi:transposase-like protein
MSTPREYKPEFREMATDMAMAGEKTVAEVARELEMPVYTLHNWVRNARKAQASSEGGSVDAQAQQQLKDQAKRIVLRDRAAPAFDAHPSAAPGAGRHVVPVGVDREVAAEPILTPLDLVDVDIPGNRCAVHSTHPTIPAARDRGLTARCQQGPRTDGSCSKT